MSNALKSSLIIAALLDELPRDVDHWRRKKIEWTELQIPSLAAFAEGRADSLESVLETIKNLRGEPYAPPPKIRP